MAWRIGDYVVRGELNNSTRNSVFGWLDFGGEWGVRIELTGNLGGDLTGKHIRFSVPLTANSDFGEARFELSKMASQQIGVVGDMSFRTVQVWQTDSDTLDSRIEEKKCLYLEWFSQDGRIVAEIVGAELATLDDDEDSLDPTDDGHASNERWKDVLGSLIAEDDRFEEMSFEEDEDDDEDEYGLFPADLQQQIDASIQSGMTEDFSDEEPGKPLGWDEVIPGIDSETMALYEQWDEVFDGKSDEPVSTLFDPPMKLPEPSQINDDSEAETLMRKLLARLALMSVAIDVCEHCSPTEAYRILMEDILPDANVHPNLSGIGMVQHYSTWETCAECEKEFEKDIGVQEMNEGDRDEDLPF